MSLLSDPGLVLGVVGATVGLAGSLTDTASKKPRVRLVCILAVLGFLSLVAQQLVTASVTAQGKAQDEALEQARDAILGEIRGTVNHTAGAGDELMRRLENTP